MGMTIIAFPASSQTFFGLGFMTVSCMIYLLLADPYIVCQVGSRLVLQTAGLLMIILGLFGKFSAVFITIPDPVIGGMFLIMFGMVAAVGISSLQVYLIEFCHTFPCHCYEIAYQGDFVCLICISLFCLAVCGLELLQKSPDSWLLDLQWSCAPNMVSFKPRHDQYR